MLLRFGNVTLRRSKGVFGPHTSFLAARALGRHTHTPSPFSTGTFVRNASATASGTGGTGSPSPEHAAPNGQSKNEQSQNGDHSSSSSEQQPKELGRVLYERRPDWYIRLIPLLIVLDIAMLYVLYLLNFIIPMILLHQGSTIALLLFSH